MHKGGNTKPRWNFYWHVPILNAVIDNAPPLSVFFFFETLEAFQWEGFNNFKFLQIKYCQLGTIFWIL